MKEEEERVLVQRDNPQPRVVGNGVKLQVPKNTDRETSLPGTFSFEIQHKY
jgi:hypothetical protein